MELVRHRSSVFLLRLGLFMFLMLCSSHGVVIITKDNHSLVFESTDASFAARIPAAGLCGTVLAGIPTNACTPLITQAIDAKHFQCSQFVLVSRGFCSFDTKIRNAQNAGFGAVIVADNVESTELVTMAGSRKGISIPAVFISKVAGNILSQYSDDPSADCWILPSSYENIAWLVMVISFISLLAVTAAFAICFLVRQHRHRNGQGRKDCNGVSYQVVKAMPSYIYECKCENDIVTTETCAICLEDYVDGSHLRILPCNHRFHCSCIDAWLVNWRSFCPVCKRNVVKAEQPSERTPLLSSIESPQVITRRDQLEVPLIIQQESAEINTRSSPQQGESNRVSFNWCPRPSVPPIRIINSPGLATLHSLSLRGSRRPPARDPVEAFRASPYFTPPSFFHNSAPNMFSPLEAASPGDSHHGPHRSGPLWGSPPFCGSPQNGGESQLQ